MFDVQQILELMKGLKQYDVNELEIENEGERILLRRGGEIQTVMAPAMLPSTPPMSAAPSMAAPSLTHVPAANTIPVSESVEASDPNVVEITSPFVGTFYRSPTPDAPPFVEPGSEIRVGNVLCIVEAMKLMNEIESELQGTILDVLVENGKPVEYGDPLFRVRKSG